MAQSVLVSDLVTIVRQRANIEKSQVCTDAEIIGYIDRAYKAMYNAIVLKYENYFMASQALTIVPGQQAYTIPTGMLKLAGVDLSVGGRTLSLQPFNFTERNRNSSTQPADSWRDMSYVLYGQTLKLNPAPGAGDAVTVWYVPVPTPITSGADTFDAINGLDEYVTVTAAIKCILKQELDPGYLMKEQADNFEMILALCADRDSGAPQRVTDVSEANDDLFRYRG